MTRKRNAAATEKETRMLKAIDAVKSKQFDSAEAAAKHFDVPASTLRHRVNGRVSRRESRGGLQKVTPRGEEELVRWITQLTSAGYSPQYSVVRDMAESIRRQFSSSSGDASLFFNPHDTTKGSLGKEWVSNFLQRHSELKSVVGKPIELSRVTETTVEALTAWFEVFEREVISDEDVLLENVYNFDESGFSIGTIQATRVIVSIRVNSRFQASPGRQEWVTVIESVCADGSAINPVVIFKGEQFNTSWVSSTNIPNGWLFSNNSKGWTSNEHGVQWLRSCFDPQTREKANGRKRVLICDGHGSHVTGKFICYCRENNIKLLILPPHSSHYTQPLDIAIFGPLKKYLSDEVRKIVGANVARLTKAEWLQCYVLARQSAFTCRNIHGAWNGAGLEPFQPRKVIRRKQGKTPPPSTPPPSNGSNPFDSVLLNSSPSDLHGMHNANKALRTKLTDNSVLATPEKQYILRLGTKVEQYKSRINILEKEKRNAEAVLSARKRAESGVRQILKGQHVVTVDSIYDKVREHEMMIEERKKKRVKRTPKNGVDVLQREPDDEQHLEIYHSISADPDNE
jgi:DDE superfamily endonuclease/Tc5 transposase DNA-binding domain/helix-turn-helix, Psq domain